MVHRISQDLPISKPALSQASPAFTPHTNPASSSPAPHGSMDRVDLSAHAFDDCGTPTPHWPHLGSPHGLSFGDKVSLNPQPLPPSPDPASRVSLNPQPLPPKPNPGDPLARLAGFVGGPQRFAEGGIIWQR